MSKIVFKGFAIAMMSLLTANQGVERVSHYVCTGSNYSTVDGGSITVNVTLLDLNEYKYSVKENLSDGYSNESYGIKRVGEKMFQYSLVITTPDKKQYVIGPIIHTTNCFDSEFVPWSLSY